MMYVVEKKHPPARFDLEHLFLPLSFPLFWGEKEEKEGRNGRLRS